MKYRIALAAILVLSTQARAERPECEGVIQTDPVMKRSAEKQDSDFRYCINSSWNKEGQLACLVRENYVIEVKKSFEYCPVQVKLDWQKANGE